MPQYIDHEQHITIHVDGNDYVIKDLRDSKETRINIEIITTNILKQENRLDAHQYGIANGLTTLQSYYFLSYVLNQIEGVA